MKISNKTQNVRETNTCFELANHGANRSKARLNADKILPVKSDSSLKMKSNDLDISINSLHHCYKERM